MNRSKFQFSNPELEKIEFQINESFSQEMYDGIAMQSNTEVKKIDGHNAYVALSICIGNETEGQPFDITVKMSAKFNWDESITEEQANKMLKINAPAVLLSYIRPIVSNMTNSSRYPCLNIPFINFTLNELN